MFHRPLIGLFLSAFFLPVSAGLFPPDEQASSYDHDRIGKLAGQTLVRLCGDADFAQGREMLATLHGWQSSDEESPDGVVIRTYPDFAGQQGLTARFRIGAKSCSLLLAPYLPNARAADELAYGISEAADKAFSDPDLPYRVEQSITGLHRTGPEAGKYQQAIYLQWMQRNGLPSHSFFALFDSSGEIPRVMLGKRPFTGQILFGMADGDWERRRNKRGEHILLRQSSDPVDTQKGGYNTIALSRSKSGEYSLKAFFPIGADSDSFRIRSSLGRAPIDGFHALQAVSMRAGRIERTSLAVSEQREFPARKALMSKGLYPVYLQLDRKALRAIHEADLVTLVIRRKGGSEIALQFPAGEALRKGLREHLGFRPAKPDD
jgi:hypothetical protein